jgi:hypothetical protein
VECPHHRLHGQGGKPHVLAHEGLIAEQRILRLEPAAQENHLPHGQVPALSWYKAGTGGRGNLNLIRPCNTTVDFFCRVSVRRIERSGAAESRRRSTGGRRNYIRTMPLVIMVRPAVET